MTKLVIGLGNPGAEYADTRHNVGFWFVEQLAASWKWSFGRSQRRGTYAKGVFAAESVYLLKPETFMNLSGQCVAPWIDFLKIAGQDTLVVHDDLDLPLGRVRAQWGAGAGGQKGVTSIIEVLGHKNFCRLRIGIGRPAHARAVVGFVLSPFSKEERGVLQAMLPRLLEAVEVFVKLGLDPMMQMINRRP